MQLPGSILNLFTIFDAIYRDGGITPASKRLHLSQPTVSHALARLRELLDDPLFERRGHDMVPNRSRARSPRTLPARSVGSSNSLQRTGRFDPGTSPRSFTIAMREVNELSRSCRCSSSGCSAQRRMSTSQSCASIARDLEEDLQAARSTSPSTSVCRCRTSVASA